MDGMLRFCVEGLDKHGSGIFRGLSNLCGYQGSTLDPFCASNAMLIHILKIKRNTVMKLGTVQVYVS